MEKRKRQIEIERSIKDFDMTKGDDLYESIGSIWGGNSIFFYHKEDAIEQLKRESEITTAERHPEYLRQTWDKKWDSMDFSWF